MKAIIEHDTESITNFALSQLEDELLALFKGEPLIVVRPCKYHSFFLQIEVRQITRSSLFGFYKTSKPIATFFVNHDQKGWSKFICKCFNDVAEHKLIKILEALSKSLGLKDPVLVRTGYFIPASFSQEILKAQENFTSHLMEVENVQYVGLRNTTPDQLVIGVSKINPSITSQISEILKNQTFKWSIEPTDNTEPTWL